MGDKQTHLVTDEVGREPADRHVSSSLEVYGFGGDNARGVYVCSCGRSWDADWFRSTTCTCGRPGEPYRDWWMRQRAPWWFPFDPDTHGDGIDYLRALRDAERRHTAAQRPRYTPPPGGPPASPQAFQARFTGLLRTVNDATEPGRNDKLHWAACRVGEMIAAGELPNAGPAVEALAAVALGAGLGPREVRGTIRSGLAKSGVVA
jgi:hypothetical protein